MSDKLLLFLAVERSLHYALDSYEFIAITVSLNTAQGLITYLEDDLKKRQDYMNRFNELLEKQFDVSF